MRVLWRGPLPVGRLGAALGVTRQAARKIADALEQRGYTTTQRDSRDTSQPTASTSGAAFRLRRRLCLLGGLAILGHAHQTAR
jgi:DNA-binding MarR family transcriptional regulator